MKLIKLRHPYLSLAVMLLTNFLIGCSVVEKAKNGPDDLTSKVILFDGSGLANWVHTDFAGKGNIFINEKKHLVMEMGAELSGLHWRGDALPKVNYEIRLEARRTMGSDFFCGLTFPYKETHATLVLGGWGGSLIGISSIDDFDASENETGDAYVFEDNKWYRIKLRVTEEELKVWIDDDLVIDCEVEGRQIGMRIGEIEMSKPLGIATYATTGEFKSITLLKIK